MHDYNLTHKVFIFMKLLLKLSFGSSVLAFLASPAFAGVTVSSPGNGAQVSSPFTLSASAATCSNQNVAAMGYSFDSSTSTSIVNGTSIDASVPAPSGSHTLHVKAWGNQGASCVTDVALSVDSTSNFLALPAGVISASALQTLGSWVGVNDTASSGPATGWTTMVGSPSLSGHAREYQISFTNSGGERFSTSFGDDTTSTNFIYDAWVYLGSNSSDIANLEFDLNQTMANGQTVIMGFQCDGWNNSWDYTANTGSPTKPTDVWVHSHQYCNPRGWGINTWHHVQIAYYRNSSGQVTYQAVYLDGLEMPINATVNSAFALGWGPVLITNFQIDGYGGSGAANVWIDNMTIYRW